MRGAAAAACLLLGGLTAACVHEPAPAPEPPPLAVLTREVIITREQPMLQLRAPEPIQPSLPGCWSLVTPAPPYPDSDRGLRAATGIYEQVQAMLAGRLARMARERELEQVIKRCVLTRPR